MSTSFPGSSTLQSVSPLFRPMPRPKTPAGTEKVTVFCTDSVNHQPTAMFQISGPLSANPTDATRQAVQAAVNIGLLPEKPLTIFAPEDSFRPSSLFSHEYTAPTGVPGLPSGLPCVARIGENGDVSHITVGADLKPDGSPATINIGEYADPTGLQIGDLAQGSVLNLAANPNGVLVARGPSQNPFLLPDGPMAGTIGGQLTPERIAALPKGDYTIPQ